MSLDLDRIVIKNHQILDIGKLGVVIERFKIVWQLGTILIHLHVLLMYCCHYL